MLKAIALGARAVLVGRPILWGLCVSGEQGALQVLEILRRELDEAMLGFAQTIVDTEERAERHFRGAELRGRVRFGVSEDFALGELPEILRRLRRSHPLVDVCG